MMALATTATAQENCRELNRTTLFISYSCNFLSNDVEQTDFKPAHITFEDVPYTDSWTVPMNCSELGLETFIHPLRRSRLFLSIGTRMQISKGTKLLGGHVKYENMASLFGIVTPLCLGYDFIYHNRVLISPSVGAELKYSTNFNEKYTRMGFGNYQISKKFDENDGLNQLQYGVTAGIDFSGKYVTMGLHYTHYLNRLFDTYGAVVENEKSTYYHMTGNTGTLQVKFGFVIDTWRK